MNTERWEHTRELFASAIELDPDLRLAFLEAMCGKDQSLFNELKSLVESYHASSSDSPSATWPLAPWVVNTHDPRKIGPFRVLRRLGSGSISDVYLAVRGNDDPNQPVAIKLLRKGVNSEEILKRFRHERQLFASLEHPNIARILDAGITHEGLYFVMDYVEGISLAIYCGQHRLSIPKRLQLLRDVCLAVHYLHQNLIVHEDLKPSNILVTSAGVIKLLDSGMAKLLRNEFSSDNREPKPSHAPWYVSPEQVRGKRVTTATDGYALGVLLYELVTGRMPYTLQSEAPSDIHKAVCEQEAEKPSASLFRVDESGAHSLSLEGIALARSTRLWRLRRECTADLDAIVLRALHKEPQSRYASAEQLAEEIRRYLEGLPVIAQGNSTSYRFNKFIRRHKAVVASTILLTVFSVAAVGVTAWQAHVARREQSRIGSGSMTRPNTGHLSALQP